MGLDFAGGKIRKSRVKNELQKLGRSILKGSLGVAPTTQPGIAVCTASHRPMSSSEIEALEERLREILKGFNLTQHRNVDVLKKRLKENFKL